MTINNVTPEHILFVCTGNTCRSVLAEYIGHQLFGGTVMFESAGINPQSAGDAENAIHTLQKNFNIDASGHCPRDVRALDLTMYSLIIALEKKAAKLVRDLGVPASKVKLWKIRDPWGPDLTEYDRASLEIKRKLLQLKASSHDGDET